jgi:rare lipoprotein A (peptidoglycan hydrolase)
MTALILALILALATPSSAPDVSPRQARSGAPHDKRHDGDRTEKPVSAPVAASSMAPARTGMEGGAPLTGTASWYCGSGSPCTRGYDPGDLIAAIDRKDTPWDKGDRLTVTSGDRSVTVMVVDVCLCKGNRVIDLSAEAFSRLAPLGLGVIPVTITEATTPALPETDMEAP